jgi:serine/threonine protein kinase
LTYSGPIAKANVIRIGLDVAKGLKELKLHNILHRDIKPANVMLSTPDVNTAPAKIVDLGLSKYLGP